MGARGEAESHHQVYMGVNLFSNFQLMKRQQNQRRPKGEGSITRLPNGRLKMTLTVVVPPDGKHRRRSVSASCLGRAGIATTLAYYSHWIPEVDRKVTQGDWWHPLGA